MTPPSHILITGASAGLGLELARLFATDGYPLVLVARSGDKLQVLAEVLRRDHEIDVRVVAADLVATGAVDELLAVLAAEDLNIRVLVNNAGIGTYGQFADGDPTVIQDLLALNITALTMLTRGLLPGLRAAAAQGVGGPLGVMNVASTAAFQPGPLMAAYFASKSYVLSFSEALHEELRGTGVNISAFCPGPTRTGFFTTQAMIPAGEITAADLAEYHRRDAKRMDPAIAARVGYEGFLAGRPIVIPGLRNRIMAQVSRFLPRAVIRRIAHRMLRK